MLRNIIKFVAIVIGLALIIYGAHGLYAYFYRLEFLIGHSNEAKLFGAISMPWHFPEYLEWMTEKGIQSWVLPGVVVAAGMGIWYWQSRYVWR
jgi:hypothetical protein